MLVRLVRMFRTSNPMKRLFTTKLMDLLLTRTVTEMAEHSTQLEFTTREREITFKVGPRLNLKLLEKLVTVVAGTHLPA